MRRQALLALALLALAAAGCGNGGRARSKVLFLSDRDGDWAIYAVDANGGGAHRVLQAGRADPFGEGLGFGEPVVSPDGRNVLLARSGVAVASLVTGTVRHLGAGEEAGASWSPDGRRVAFSGPQAEGLEVVELRNGRKRELVQDSQIWTPAWSPDGKWIAFARQIGSGPTEVYVTHPDGSGLRRVTDYSPQGSSSLAWSRAGQLAFIGSLGPEQPSHLVVVSVPAGRVAVAPQRLADGMVAWSPDGRTIVYSATTEPSRGSAIFVAGADGRRRRRLTQPWPPASYSSPVWSPDGKSLLYVRAPVGGGAARGLPEVWTMAADGTHERQLTTAYPDGGDNVEPAWASADVRTETVPRPHELRNGQTVVLRVPFPVDGIAATGAEGVIAPVAYGMELEYQKTPPLLVWKPGHGETARVSVAPCGGVDQLVVAGSRLAFDCSQSFFDELEQSFWVVDLRTRIPREAFLGHGGPGPGGMLLDNVVGSGGLLAFGSETDPASGGRLLTLWRVDGFLADAIRSGPSIGDVVAASDRRLAVELPNGRISILSAAGKALRTINVPHPRSRRAATQFRLVGDTLVVLGGRTLSAYDVETAALRWARSVPPGAHLEDADGRLVVYTAGPAIHILSRAHERIVQTGARVASGLRPYVDRPVQAALTADGLYYSFDVDDRRDPGRVVFIPRSALPR
jgi:Tol biopolymer transport system component